MLHDTFDIICTKCGHMLLSWPKTRTWAMLCDEAVTLGGNFYSYVCRRCEAQALLSYEAGTLRHHGSLAYPDADVPRHILDHAIEEARRDGAALDQSLERLRRVRERVTAEHRRKRELDKKDSQP
jgi:hypothetical protein